MADSDLDRMVFLLKAIDASDLPDANDEEIFLNVEPRRDEVNEIIGLANTVLVDDAGKNIYENHEYLKTFGYWIFAGEQDRFGWLTGCIQTKKGIIVYG